MIHARLTDAGTEMEQMYNGGWLIAGGLTELSAQSKAVSSEVLFLVYFWAFSRTKNQDWNSFLGVFISQHQFRICLLCAAHLVLSFAEKAKKLFVCSGVLGLFLFYFTHAWVVFWDLIRKITIQPRYSLHLSQHQFNLIAVSKLLTLHGGLTELSKWCLFYYCCCGSQVLSQRIQESEGCVLPTGDSAEMLKSRLHRHWRLCL